MESKYHNDFIFSIIYMKTVEIKVYFLTPKSFSFPFAPQIHISTLRFILI